MRQHHLSKDERYGNEGTQEERHWWGVTKVTGVRKGIGLEITGVRQREWDTGYKG
ncbi:putative aldolase-type TIM barrel [Sesbania bispinosa]|nr:putative aldolase-type TIM barrel [Sesbania bispinosa]